MNILVFKEKHGDRYMKASTTEEVQESCLKVLRERMEDEWYYEPDEPTKPVCSREDAEKLPDPYREAALEAWRLYSKSMKWFEQDKDWFDAAKDEVRRPKGAAYKLLCCRRDGEYEGFEIVGVE